ncbi:exodeoxyribonuclease VII large subunit [Intrasporangium oryzae NRRL B-24470]|uniref:Exodeoxyribonuclease 7 large subunit n=1 Tax=Intrasporangium oryzae NRRL B-24470 TaxID=1386089 RepID=W9GAL6_9MICO|nr:exodeoxyribonuclease VII large subunit [Intrasporangium oryzae]EWT03090.1 exodeoxyribonuclease VII large subunit [Intrasporangium oryzae NRRL B-24470]
MTNPLPEKAADTTAEQPWPVRVLSLKISDYVDRMSQLWVEGQVVQFSPRGSTAYLTLRDPDVDMSLSVSVPMNAVSAMAVPLTQGARVVLQAKPTFWTKRGTLQLEARQIRPVGIGDLLARVEILKRTLAAEGLFDADRKRPIPFLPHTVGLITGRSSAAEKDVVENARRRWPAVRFAIREVAVQGAGAVTEVVAALRELDADRTVDVIVIARGGGALEELLPFSNEAMVRAVAEARTPVISAIGHDVDQPLLDLVADWRASTPTDAGKKVVPDAHLERSTVAGARDRLRGAMDRRIESERRGLRALVSRPVMADPVALVRARRDEIAHLRSRASTRVEARLHRAADQVEHLRRQVVALSPQSTLERGYAVVQHRDGRVVMDPGDAGIGELLRVRVARGDFSVRPVDPGTADDPASTGTTPPARRRTATSTTRKPAAAKPADPGAPATTTASKSTTTRKRASKTAAAAKSADAPRRTRAPKAAS